MTRRRQKLVHFWVEQTPDGFTAYSNLLDAKLRGFTGKGETGYRAVLDCVTKIVALEDETQRAVPGESE